MTPEELELLLQTARRVTLLEEAMIRHLEVSIAFEREAQAFWNNLAERIPTVRP